MHVHCVIRDKWHDEPKNEDREESLDALVDTMSALTEAPAIPVCYRGIHAVLNITDTRSGSAVVASKAGDV